MTDFNNECTNPEVDQDCYMSPAIETTKDFRHTFNEILIPSVWDTEGPSTGETVDISKIKPGTLVRCYQELIEYRDSGYWLETSVLEATESNGSEKGYIVLKDSFCVQCRCGLCSSEETNIMYLNDLSYRNGVLYAVKEY